MKILSHVAVLTFVTVGQFATTSARAQSADSLTKVKSEGSVGAASAAPVDTAVHKKGGMFGKLKGVAHNRTVQNIAKAAACQAVPGGQYVIGAAEAAKAKTSIASGAANAQSCIPGMGGAGAGLGGLGGKGALAGAAMGAAGALGGGAAGQAAASAKGMPGMPGMPEMSNGAAMSATAQGLAGMQAAMAQMQAASIAAGGAGGAGEMTSEASGEQMKLSGAVPDEIRKGKLVIRKIDWVRGNISVSPPATQGFTDLMLSAGQAMKAAGGTYRVDIYMDKRYSDEEIAALGAQRTMVVVSSLQAGGLLGEAVVPGKIGKDKEQRVEIVKVK
jgi:hypothetical protein